ncbi:MAG: hypothetical protein WCK15_23070 [Pirellula sp.]
MSSLRKEIAAGKKGLMPTPTQIEFKLGSARHAWNNGIALSVEYSYA